MIFNKFNKNKFSLLNLDYNLVKKFWLPEKEMR